MKIISKSYFPKKSDKIWFLSLSESEKKRVKKICRNIAEINHCQLDWKPEYYAISKNLI